MHLENITLSTEQMAVAFQIIAPKSKGVLVVQAGGGTGKSTLLNYISKLTSPYSILKASTSNTSAKNVNAVTLHKLLNLRMVDTGEELAIERYASVTLANTVILVDEYSMLSQELLDFLIAMKPKLLVLFGDTAQLPSPGKARAADLSKIEHTVLSLGKNFRAENTLLAAKIETHRNGAPLISRPLTFKGAIRELKGSDSVLLNSNNAEVIRASELLLNSRVNKAYFMQAVKGYISDIAHKSPLAKRLTIIIAHKKDVVNVANFKPNSLHDWGHVEIKGSYTRRVSHERYGITANDGLHTRPISVKALWDAVLEEEIHISYKNFEKDLFKIAVAIFGDTSHWYGAHVTAYKELLAGGTGIASSEESQQLARACFLEALLPLGPNIWINVSQENSMPLEQYDNLITSATVYFNEVLAQKDYRSEEAAKALKLLRRSKFVDLMIDYTAGSVEVGSLKFKTRLFDELKQEEYQEELELRKQLLQIFITMSHVKLSSFIKIDPKNTAAKSTQIWHMLKFLQDVQFYGQAHYQLKSGKYKLSAYFEIAQTMEDARNALLNLKGQLDDVQAMRSAQSMTVYMSQGLSFDNVLIGKVNKNQIYTAVSRARSSFKGVKV